VPQKAKGWLRRKTYAEGEVWLFCYNVPRPGNRPAENSQLIGLVRDFPSENDAWREIQLKGYWKLVDPSLSISPTFGELAQHFRLYELKRNGPLSKRANETVATHESMLDGYVLPRWGSVRAADMTVPLIEAWFEDLATMPIGRNYADGQQPPNGYQAKPLEWTSIQKIRSTMSLVFSHALRHRLIQGDKEVNPFRNPKTEGGVRCIAVSNYDATIVTPEQMILILEFLNTETTQMEWTIALLLAATALRPEEGFGIKWQDIDFKQGQINLQRAWSKGEETDGKNLGALVPVPMHAVLAGFLLEWRRQSLYPNDDDWVFPSLKLKGAVPRSSSIAARHYLRPAAINTGVIAEGSSKRFGWHNLRHSLAEFLAGEVDAAVTMKILRHRRIGTTLEHYTHRISDKQRAAQGLFLNAIGKNKAPKQKPTRRAR
jgi:integrase